MTERKDGGPAHCIMCGIDAEKSQYPTCHADLEFFGCLHLIQPGVLSKADRHIFVEKKPEYTISEGEK